MEVLAENYDELEHIEPNWDLWLQYDNRPKIVGRGVDFSADVSTIKRHLFTETARRDLDVTVRVLHGDRLLFQVFDPSGATPRLPDMPDARNKYNWNQWFNGEKHTVITDSYTDATNLRNYIYKMAARKGLKVRVTVAEAALEMQTYRADTANRQANLVTSESKSKAVDFKNEVIPKNNSYIESETDD